MIKKRLVAFKNQPLLYYITRFEATCRSICDVWKLINVRTSDVTTERSRIPLSLFLVTFAFALAFLYTMVILDRDLLLSKH